MPTLLIAQALRCSSGLPLRPSEPPVSLHPVQLFSQPGQRLPLLTQLPLRDGTHLFLRLLLCLGSRPGLGSHQQSPQSQPGAFPAPTSLQRLALRSQILNHLQGSACKGRGFFCWGAKAGPFGKLKGWVRGTGSSMVSASHSTAATLGVAAPSQRAQAQQVGLEEDPSPATQSLFEGPSQGYLPSSTGETPLTPGL